MSTSSAKTQPPATNKPAPLLPELEKDAGWTQQNTPELIKWDTPGETFMGVLTDVTNTNQNGKNVPQYLLVLGDKRFTFLGTWDIVQKIGKQHIGCQVRIKYLGEDDSVRGGPNNQPMKRFSIQTRGTPTPQPQGGPITNDDIGF